MTSLTPERAEDLLRRIEELRRRLQASHEDFVRRGCISPETRDPRFAIMDRIERFILAHT